MPAESQINCSAQRMSKRAASSPGQRPLSRCFFMAPLIADLAWFVPELLAKPPEPVDYFEVMVVPPQALGSRTAATTTAQDRTRDRATAPGAAAAGAAAAGARADTGRRSGSGRQEEEGRKETATAAETSSRRHRRRSRSRHAAQSASAHRSANPLGATTQQVALRRRRSRTSPTAITSTGWWR